MRRRLWAAVLVALFAVAATGTHAYADPTVGEIEKQIDAAWNQAEPLVEKYNATHEQYLKNKARQVQLQKKIAPLQLEVDLAEIQVGALAASAYRGGRIDTMSAFLVADNPTEFIDSLVYLDSIARHQASQIQSVRVAKDEFEALKAPIDQLVAELAEQDADLAAQKKEIERRLADLQKLRRQAYGSTGGTGTYRPWPCPSEYLPTKGYKAAQFACRQAGKPYVWAASGPSSYDCSGLTLAAWKQVGVYLPHNAAAQRRSMPYVTRANIQIGDLVFYYSDLHHVAIYVGGGKVMSAPQPGDVVRMIGMDMGPIHSIGRPG